MPARNAGSALRIACRLLRQAPGFSLTIVLTLALGIGATTAMFSLVEGVLLRPLPFHDPGRLVLVGDHLGNSPNLPITAREIRTYETASTAFSSMGAFIYASYERTGIAVPEVIPGARLSGSMFPTLGVTPAVGRVFTQQEDDAHAPLAVISYACWLTRFHRDPHVAGTSITLNGRAFTIIGVMPRSFEFPLQAGRIGQAEIWTPLSLTADELSDGNTGLFGYHVVGRVRNGVSLAQASQDAERVSHQVMREYPANMAYIRIRGEARPLRETLIADARPLLRTLFLAVSIVLLIACANVAVLLLVRALRRRREHALRLALGAPASAILREAMLEGLVLSLSGGLLGLALAAAALRSGVSHLPESMPRIDSIVIDPAVALFALALALATGIACSLAPAWAALRANLLETLRSDSRTGTGSVRQGWLRSTLIVAEIAIALVLLTMSGAFLRSYQKMLAVDPGYEPAHVLVAGYQIPARNYTNDAAIESFNREVLRRLGDEPSVAAVALANTLPASGTSSAGAFTIEGVPAADWRLKFSPFTLIEGDYFRALSVRLIAGRFFTERDRADAPLVVIVNQTMAARDWPGQSALGKRMHIGNPKKGLPWATVVGVVADTKPGSPDALPDDQFYLALEQPAMLNGPTTPAQLTLPTGGFIALRSTLPPEQMMRTLRSVVAGIDAQLVLDPVQPMAESVSNIEAPRRFNTRLISGFALAALLLAAMGIYAVMAFSVSLRTQEIAIRMAVGAQRSGIARLILGAGAKIALLGCGLGVAGSFAVARLVRAFLFGVSATDPLIYLGSVAVMLALALAASALPAWRAAAADPARSLRSA